MRRRSAWRVHRRRSSSLIRQVMTSWYVSRTEPGSRAHASIKDSVFLWGSRPDTHSTNGQVTDGSSRRMTSRACSDDSAGTKNGDPASPTTATRSNGIPQCSMRSRRVLSEGVRTRSASRIVWTRRAYRRGKLSRSSAKPKSSGNRWGMMSWTTATRGTSTTWAPSTPCTGLLSSTGDTIRYTSGPPASARRNAAAVFQVSWGACARTGSMWRGHGTRGLSASAATGAPSAMRARLKSVAKRGMPRSEWPRLWIVWMSTNR